MKKILIALIALLPLYGCWNNSQGTKEESESTVNTFDPDLVEVVNRYNTVKSVENIKSEKINIRVFQTFSDNSCLAKEYESGYGGYGFYTGPIVLFVPKEDNLSYDEMVYKGTVYFIGTFTYETSAGDMKTVKTYFEDYDFACAFVELANEIKGQER